MKLKINEPALPVWRIPPRSGSKGLLLAWLGVIFAVILWPPSTNYSSTLFFLIIVISLAAYGFIRDAQSDVRNLFSLLNAVWVCLLLYNLTIYLLYGLFDISILIGLEPEFLIAAARLSLISLAVAGSTVELLKAWGSDLHRNSMRLLAQPTSPRQYLVAIALTGLYLYNYIKSGVVDVLSSGNRFLTSMVFANAGSDKMWVVQYLMTGVTIAFIYQFLARKHPRRSLYYINLFSIIIFWLLFLSLGNRRGIISVVLSASVCFAARSPKIRFVLLLLAFAFLASGIIAVLRQDLSTADADKLFILNLGNFFGEFLYPGYTLVHLVTTGHEPTLELTWITMPFDFIFSQILGYPFRFIGQVFAETLANSADEVMGFAYLPITEWYFNFGDLGAVFSGASLITSSLFFAWIFRSHCWIYLLLFSLSFDINRADFASFLVQFFIVAVGFLLTTSVRPRGALINSATA